MIKICAKSKTFVRNVRKSTTGKTAHLQRRIEVFIAVNKHSRNVTYTLRVNPADFSFCNYFSFSSCFLPLHIIYTYLE